MKCYSINIQDKGVVNINGNIITSVEIFDPVLALDGCNKIYENITQILTASADSLKKPYI